MSLEFPQKFLHIKKSISLDENGDPVVVNGQELEVFVINRVLDGLLTKRRQLAHREDQSSFESTYIHNVRIDPSQIEFKDILGGDLMVLLDIDEIGLIENYNNQTQKIILNEDGSLTILLGENVITVNKNFELPFFVETIFPCFDPVNPKKLWYIRCELRKTNTSNV
jgi:hypothetical protein